MKRLYVYILSALLLLACVACAAKTDIYGEWKASYDGSVVFGFPDRIEFMRDGTCIVDDEYGEYTTGSGRLLLSVMGTKAFFDYRLENNYLYLSNESDEVEYYLATEPAPAAAPAAESQDAYYENTETEDAVPAEDAFAPEQLDGSYECDGFTYMLYSDRTATVNGYVGEDDSDEPGLEVTIPSHLDGYPVTAIQEFCASDLREITGVTLPDTVTTLREFAFAGLSELEWVMLPDSLTTIGERTFAGCESLRQLTIPAKVKSIGINAFVGCEQLQITVSDRNSQYCAVDNVLFSKDMTQLIAYIGYEGADSYTVPNGVDTIKDAAFYGCQALRSITLPDGLVTIGMKAFYGCRSLQSIVVPEGVVNIGDDAFSECRALAQISLPDTATSIGDFYGCAFESFTVPGGITNLTSSFQECSALKVFIIPPNVTELHANFMDCLALETFYVPEGVTSVYLDFEGSFNLESIYIPNSATDIYRQICITSRETAATLICHAGSYAEELAMNTTSMPYRIE